MKKLILLISALLVYASSLAQDPELLDRFWYVTKLNLSGNDFFPPEYDPDYGYHFLYIHYEGSGVGDFFLESCHAGAAGVTFDGEPNEFNVELPIVILLSDCFNNDYQTYENMYFGFYDDNAAEPFTYEITDEGNGALSMIVTASNGDKVYYGNDLLTNGDLSIADFHVYPNPVQDELFVNSKGNSIDGITVYSLTGQQLIYRTGQTNSIDVSSLSDGIYFLEIVSEGKKQVQKFVKN